MQQIAPVDANAVAEAVAHYRKGRVADGDALARESPINDTRRAGMAGDPLQSGHDPLCRIKRFLDANPDWPNQMALQRRAEEALSAERLAGADAIAFFAARTPVTAVAASHWPRACRQRRNGPGGGADPCGLAP